jgi:hypothetical protein
MTLLDLLPSGPIVDKLAQRLGQLDQFVDICGYYLKVDIQSDLLGLFPQYDGGLEHELKFQLVDKETESLRENYRLHGATLGLLCYEIQEFIINQVVSRYIRE